MVFFGYDPASAVFMVVGLAVEGAGEIEGGIVIRAGEGKDADGALGECLAEGVDDRAHGSACGEDVVDEEERRGWRGRESGCWRGVG